MSQSIRLEVLNKDKMIIHIDEIMKISKEAFADKSWNDTHYLHDLSDKWRLSSMIRHHNKVVGFMIVSSFFLNGIKTAHSHNSAIQKSYRGMGLYKIAQSYVGQGLFQELLKHTRQLCKRENINQITAEITDGISPPRFDKLLERYGFVQVVDKDIIVEYLKEKNKINLLQQYVDYTSKLYIDTNF